MNADAKNSGAKGYRMGTHRACHPTETYERFRCMMQRCGITRLANITGLDSVNVPVYVAVRPNSRGLSTAQGKGLDAAAARTSAMMESFESWHGEQVFSDGHYLRAPEVEDLQGARTINLDGLCRRGAGDAWMRTRRMNWVRGEDLLGGGSVYAPYECVSTDFTGTGAFSPLIRTTNGLASGNTLDEAVLHGIYEVLERDAVSLWSKSAGPGDRVVDPGSVTDSYNAVLLDRLAEAGLEVLIRWVSCDTRIPVFAVTIAPGTSWRDPPYAAFSGYGAHLDPHVALARALTEAVQSRLTLIHGARDDLWPSVYAKVQDHRAADGWANRVGATEPTLNFGDVDDLSTDSFSSDLSTVLSFIRVVAEEVVAVDLTHQEIGIPVAKVVIPGLAGIPFDERPRAGGRSQAPDKALP